METSKNKQVSADDKEWSQTIKRAEKICGYQFKNKRLLLQALTHPSMVESGEIGSSYERLEFLGDSLLGSFIAQVLFTRFPEYNEGMLTRIKVSLISGGNLCAVARKIGLGDIIIFGSSEKGTGKRGLSSALENVYEALTAAIALDGGLNVAFDWAFRTLELDDIDDSAAKTENPKSVLQELLQAEHITPTYELIDTKGPPHARVFSCNVLSNGKVIGSGTGRSKKEAEASAARFALTKLQEHKN